MASLGSGEQKLTIELGSVSAKSRRATGFGWCIGESPVLVLAPPVVASCEYHEPTDRRTTSDGPFALPPAASPSPRVATLGPMDPSQALPFVACWGHRVAREGFEVTFRSPVRGGGVRFDGTTVAVESGAPFEVRYEIEVDDRWVTRSAVVRSRTVTGSQDVRLRSDGEGHWDLDGRTIADLDGCLDVDLESSVLTNALPILRAAPRIGSHLDAPAAYVRVSDLSVGRLAQEYQRLADGPGTHRFLYRAPAFDFESEIRYAEDGLVEEYDGLAVRRR